MSQISRPMREHDLPPHNESLLNLSLLPLSLLHSTLLYGLPFEAISTVKARLRGGGY